MHILSAHLLTCVLEVIDGCAPWTEFNEDPSLQLWGRCVQSFNCGKCGLKASGADNQLATTVVSDGMFCNYGWDVPMIVSSKKLATKLGRSPLDVYMGVPAGQSGAGTWQTVQSAVQNGVSVALWGSGWPFSNRTDEVSFQSLMDQFWGSGLDPQSGIAAVIDARPAPLALPFCTTFNQGQGRMFYWPLHGTIDYGATDWNNLSLQDVVTTYRDSVWTASGNADAFTLGVSYDLALDGGSSLLLSAGSDAVKGAFSVIDLYLTAWPLAIVVMAPIAGRLIGRYPDGLLGGIGLALLATGLALLAALPAQPGNADIVWRMALCGVGFGLFQSPNNHTIVTTPPPQRSGAASGMLGTARLTGQTLGAVLLAGIFSVWSPHDGKGQVIALGLAACCAAVAAVCSSLRTRAR